MRRASISYLLEVLCLCGCAYGTGTYKEEQSLSAAQIKKLEAGRTTKEEVLKSLGPPNAVVRQDEGKKTMPGENVEARSFVELFAARQALGPDDVIYYYRNAEVRSSSGMIVLVYHQEVRKVAKRLWILFDSRGIVKDFIVREE